MKNIKRFILKKFALTIKGSVEIKFD